MKHSWLILTKRYGADIRNPTSVDLRSAVRELFDESLPGMTQDDYEEHGAAHLRLGCDDGPMYVLDVSRSGVTTFEQWADHDFEVELAPAATLNTTEQRAVELLELLANGSVKEVRAAFNAGA